MEGNLINAVEITTTLNLINNAHIHAACEKVGGKIEFLCHFSIKDLLKITFVLL